MMTQLPDESIALIHPRPQPVIVGTEVYALLESIAELPPPSWRELVPLLQDPDASHAAAVHAAPLITGELARLVLENGLIQATERIS